MLKVKGFDGIVRDENTGAILSIDNTEYAKYINKRDRIKQERQEIETLKSDVSEIKELLYRLLNKE